MKTLVKFTSGKQFAEKFPFFLKDHEIEAN